MNPGEEITSLFRWPFLAAGGIPTMSPWKSWSFLSDCLRADNSVEQQHLLPQSPPLVLAALGLYSRNSLSTSCLPGKAWLEFLLANEHIQHISSCSIPYSFSMATLQLFGVWVEPMVWQSLESPSAQGLSPAMAGQADCPGQLRPFWDLLCSTALVLTSAISVPSQKGPQTLLAALQWRKVSLGIVLSTAAQDF